jgi:hypothetical protein
MKERLNIIKAFYNWLSEFFQKPFGLFLFFCTLVFAGIWYSERQLEQGKIDGKSFAKTEISSLKNEVRKDSIQIKKLDIEIFVLSKRLDSCKNSTSTENLNREVLRRIDEAERMKKQLQMRISTIENYQKNIDQKLK